MTDKDKSLKNFLKEHTKDNFTKPTNEFSELLERIEHKPFNIFKLPKWAYAATGALALTVFLLYTSVTPIYSAHDEQLMTFLTLNFDESIYEEDSDENNTLLSLVD